MEISSSSVVNILTLRYDPSINPNLPKKTWKDFESTNGSPNLDFIENSILEEIETKLKSINSKEISVAISGGVDSTLVLSLLRKVNPDLKINAVSMKFANSVDESSAASKIAEKYEAEHHIIHLENYLDKLPKAISIVKLPFWDLHWYHVIKKSQTFSKILISGDGGDELFGGYIFRYKKFLSLTSKTSTPLEKVKVYLQCHERDRVADQEKIFNNKCEFSWSSIYNILLPFFDNNLPRLEQVYLADYNGKLLYNFNPINSRLTDYFKMNSLTPLLNNKLLATSPHIATKYKYDMDNEVGKLPLRDILARNNAESLITKEKLGFSVNTINLWKSYGHSLCKEFLGNSRVVRDGWINKDWILKHIDNSELDVKYINKFLGILALEIWFRIFVTKEMNGQESLSS